VSWYRENKDEWKQIIETVAAEEHRTTQMVEKDTIQSMFLLGLSRSEIQFVFKGGTSLSKAYDLIDRFSEDIDLSMNRKPTESEKKKTKTLIMNIAENLGCMLVNPEYDIRGMLKEIIETRFYEPDYNNITKKLLYEDVSYDEAVNNGIKIVAETELF